MSNVHNISIDDLRLMSASSSSSSSSSTTSSSTTTKRNQTNRKLSSSSQQNIIISSSSNEQSNSTTTTTTIIVPQLNGLKPIVKESLFQSPLKRSLSDNEESSSLDKKLTNGTNGHIHYDHQDQDQEEENKNHIKLSSPRKYSTEVDYNHENTTAITTTTNADLLLSMQPFLVESDDDLYKDLFVPCMVYLPVKCKLTKPLQVCLRLKPVDNTGQQK